MGLDHVGYYTNLEIAAGLCCPTWLKTNSATLSDIPDPKEELWRKSTAKLLRSYFKKLVLEINPIRFIEIGAHEASISIELKELGISEVLAFEANPYVYEKYIQQVKNHGVDYKNLAISNQSGNITLSIPKFSESLARADGSILSRSAGAEYVEVSIEAKKLSDIGFNNLTSKDLVALWIDTEGVSFEVIKSSESFSEQIALMLVEVEDISYWENQKKAIEIFELCASLKLIPIMRDLDGRGQYNVIFLKQDLIKSIGGTISTYWKDLGKLKYEFEEKINPRSSLTSFFRN